MSQVEQILMDTIVYLLTLKLNVGPPNWGKTSDMRHHRKVESRRLQPISINMYLPSPVLCHSFGLRKYYTDIMGLYFIPWRDILLGAIWWWMIWTQNSKRGIEFELAPGTKGYPSEHLVSHALPSPYEGKGRASQRSCLRVVLFPDYIPSSCEIEEQEQDLFETLRYIPPTVRQ